MYKVIKYFTDLHDKNHPYDVGDVFPRKGIQVTDERLAELSGNANKRGEPLIELAKEDEPVEKAEKADNTETPVKKPVTKKPVTKKSAAKKAATSAE